MPRHFEEPRRRGRETSSRLYRQRGVAETVQNVLRRGNRRKPDGEPDAGGVPVEPNNPRDLSGGAAAVPETEQ
ncbi:MAG TPA: hypothetical protein VGF77_09655 [Allosphingosinicella sp.]|jgi:hypothetical protein